MLLECNLHVHDCYQVAKNSMFLGDVLAGWCTINSLESTQSVAKEIIWNNSQIRSDNKVLFYRWWFERGIKFLEHIYDFRTKQFYTLGHLQLITKSLDPLRAQKIFIRKKLGHTAVFGY